MSETPSAYDIIQDQAIEGLQDIVTPYYQPPSETEYSFPVVGQGITADQYRLMSLGQANGIIHGDNGVINDSPNSTGWRYYLDGHATDAETNQRNTLMLRAGTSAEAILEGFYHRLTEDMELSFPPVTTDTTYHVCLTFDPRREEDPSGPIHVEVYAGEPPTTHGRVHLLLHTVERRPNQLLSQATRTRYRPYTAGLLSVQNRNQLPDPTEYPAGTVVVPSAEGQGLYVRQNGGHVWLDPISHKADKPGSWRNMTLSSNALEVSGTAVYREVAEGVQLYVHLNMRTSASGSYICFFPDSSGISFQRPWYIPAVGASGATGSVYASPEQYFERGILANISSAYVRCNTIIPDYVLS
jgi:hypothetical protein